MSIELITILMFAGLILLLISGLPIVFCLGGAGVIFAYFLWGPAALGIVNRSILGMTSNFTVLAIPLFVFMAFMLQYAGVAENLYDMMHKWFGPVKGGLAMGTVVICAIIAAMSGLSATGTLTMSLTALPAMLKRKYDKSIAIGSIMAGGALGPLIPPSVPMVVYCFLVSTSIGRMFLGGFLPGLLLTFLLVIYIGIRSYIQPNLCPALPPGERATWSEKFRSLRKVILPILLIAGTLGTIFAGIATPTEGAAIGALGSILCSVINRKFTWGNMKMSTYGTLRLTAMLMWIMIGASAFNAVYTGLGATELIKHTISTSGLNPWYIVILMQLTLFILGCIMDPNGILMITIPIYVPVIVELGFDPIWFGILFIMNMECAYLTPPFGWNIFYLKQTVPKGITLGDIYRSVPAFVAIQLVGLALVMIFPKIVLYLPNTIMGSE
jgi:tripartite ATP-independent transporter DctM subunit